MNRSSYLTPRILLAFACVYLFWGSTYVAIRFGVEVLPPYALAGIRPLIAGPLMLALCAARGLKLRLTRRELVMTAAIGILMMGLGNGGCVWAEQYLGSGLVSLLFAVVPLYVALFEVILPGGEALRPKGWAGIAIGFAGLVILLSPGLRHIGGGGASRELLGSAVAVGAAGAWSCGSILSRRAKLQTGAFVAAAWEVMFAGVFNGSIMLATHSLRGAHWTRQGVLSIAWLIIFGSLVGYSAYIYLLDHVPVAKVSTYAYINPAIAVLLSAALLGERMVPVEYAGMAAILVAVYLVTSSKMASEKVPVDEAFEPV